MEDESDATMSGGEWDGGDDDEDVDDNIIDDEEDEDADMSESGESADELIHELAGRPSLVVSLRYPKKPAASASPADLELEATPMTNGFANPAHEAAPTAIGDYEPTTNGVKQATAHYKPSNLHQVSSAENIPILAVASEGVFHE